MRSTPELNSVEEQPVIPKKLVNTDVGRLIAHFREKGGPFIGTGGYANQLGPKSRFKSYELLDSDERCYDSETLAIYYLVQATHRRVSNVIGLQILSPDEDLLVDTPVINLFIPRSPELADFTGLTNAVTELHLASRSKCLRVINNTLYYRDEEIEGTIRELTYPLKPVPTPSGITYSVPGMPRPKRRNQGIRTVSTLTNKDDSIGKVIWREKVLNFVKRIFPDGYESIPKSERMLVCFPGLKEGRQWLEFGFSDEELCFIEKDPEILNILGSQGNFARATIANARFARSKKQTSDEIAKPFVAKANQLNRTFSIINIDPENKLTTNFVESVTVLINELPLGTDLFIGANFTLNRGGTNNLAKYAEIAGRPLDTFSNKEELYNAAFSNVVPLALANSQKADQYEQVGSPEIGNYTGNNTTTMYFAMHHFRKITNTP